MAGAVSLRYDAVLFERLRWLLERNENTMSDVFKGTFEKWPRRNVFTLLDFFVFVFITLSADEGLEMWLKVDLVRRIFLVKLEELGDL